MIKDFDVKEALLASARTVFLEEGFERASLRRVCREAGLTTGAFYSHFATKEDLFDALVASTVRDFHEMYQSVIVREMEDLATGEENEVQSIGFLRAHAREFKLLFDCSDGTKYQGFKEELINHLFFDSYRRFFRYYVDQDISDALVKIILHMKFEEYVELAYGGYTEQEVKELIPWLNAYTEGGFRRLMEMNQTG